MQFRLKTEKFQALHFKDFSFVSKLKILKKNPITVSAYFHYTFTNKIPNFSQKIYKKKALQAIIKILNYWHLFLCAYTSALVCGKLNFIFNLSIMTSQHKCLSSSSEVKLPSAHRKKKNDKYRVQVSLKQVAGVVFILYHFVVLIQLKRKKKRVLNKNMVDL